MFEICAESVVQLWKRSDPLKKYDATIKCMSATPVESASLTAFGIAKKDHFTFLNTPDEFHLGRDSIPATATWKATAKVEKVATHGVLIFDKQRKLRYRYVGDRPIGDLDEITYALMELKDPHASPRGRFHRAPVP